MTPYQARLFTEICNLLATIPQATDYAAGVLLADLRQLLTEYATADFIITRCECDTFMLPLEHEPHLIPHCRNCNQPFDRLLSDGTWQSQQVRDKLNARQLEAR